MQKHRRATQMQKELYSVQVITIIQKNHPITNLHIF